MKRKAYSMALVALLGLCACSPQSGPQSTLADQLREADRVVLSNPLNRVTFTMSNKQTKKIIRALKASQEIPSKGLTAIKEYTLAFFSGTNHLATVPSSQTVFWIDGKPYLDKSGTLEAVYEQHPFGFTLAP
jgi:hypothetical protein